MVGLLSTFPKLMNATHEIMNDMSVAYQSEATAVFEGPEALKGFDATKEYWRGVPMTTISQGEEWEPGTETGNTRQYEDYELLMKKRYYRFKKTIPQAVIDAGARALYDFVTETLKVWYIEKQRWIDKFAANFINYGSISTGHTFFDNTVRVEDGPKINDPYGNYNVGTKALFATDHPRGKIDTTTFSNFEAATYAFTRANLETKWGVYSVTNAYDRAGMEIVQFPDTIIGNPLSKFTFEPVLQSQFKDADLQKNVSQGLVSPIYSRYLIGTPTNATTSQWILTKRKETGIVVVTQWGNDAVNYWEDKDKHYQLMDLVFSYGGIVYDPKKILLCNQSAT